MKTHLTQTESLTVVIDDKEITVTAQQLLGLKQAETTDPDEKYRVLCNELIPTYQVMGMSCASQLSAQRVRTYIKMLNIAAKLNGEADWNEKGVDGWFFESDLIVIKLVKSSCSWRSCNIKFRTEELALEALTYLNSEDKIAMFGTDKVKED
jgi:hypothetical protein